MGSAVFTDGSSQDAASAYAVLAGSSFQQCWASTSDQLNTQQGDVVPQTPSTVSPLATPHLGSESTGFSINVNYWALGPSITGTFGNTVIRSGPSLLLLLTLAYDATFPDSTRLSIARDIRPRHGRLEFEREHRIEREHRNRWYHGNERLFRFQWDARFGRKESTTKGSVYVAMGDSYSPGEGSDWPPGQSVQTAGCNYQLYQGFRRQSS